MKVVFTLHYNFVLGESNLVNAPYGVVVYAGTEVKSGTGKIIAVGVGVYTHAGSVDRLNGYVNPN
jgi:hypothetical protein